MYVLCTSIQSVKIILANYFLSPSNFFNIAKAILYFSLFLSIKLSLFKLKAKVVTLLSLLNFLSLFTLDHGFFSVLITYTVIALTNYITTAKGIALLKAILTSKGNLIAISYKNEKE